MLGFSLSHGTSETFTIPATAGYGFGNYFSSSVISVPNADDYIVYLLNQGNYMIYQQENSPTCINAGCLNV